jgi:poly(A) polymerase
VGTTVLNGNDDDNDNDNKARLEYIINESDLVSLDESEVRSMNGVRVTQYILDNVPNLQQFQITLCAVKEWTRSRGLYSNVLGFLGGINVAILVAWICKRHPNHQPASLLRVFFRKFATWQWPNPVLLCPVEEDPPKGVAPMKVWNKTRDSHHILPIITPVYPSSKLRSLFLLSLLRFIPFLI